MTPREKRQIELARLFKELPSNTQIALTSYTIRDTSRVERNNNDVVYVPLSIIDMKKLSEPHLVSLNVTTLGDSFRDYLEAKLQRPVSSQGYLLERKYLS